MSQNQPQIPVFYTIRSQIDHMPRIQKKIAQYVFEHPTEVINMSLRELAQAIGVKSDSAIVRFFKSLGFAGYYEFKVSLATEIAGKSFHRMYEDISMEDDFRTVKQKLFQATMRVLDENLSALDEEQLEQAVTLIEQSNRLFFLGFGTAGTVAYDGYFKFSELGFTCHYSSDPHFNASILSEPRIGDVLFCISYTGETRDVLVPAERAKPPAKIIALTRAEDSPLKTIADVCIATVAEKKNYSVDVMLTRLVQMSVINTLYLMVGLRQGPQILDKLSNMYRSVSYLRV
ncbi:transcriptional regulator, RpiR family [Candidatus Moduliflexus flocculans]|uniref:Transcriptional regulator, RpiR family n=1 Tax=Candidatus Moduliflexus flocculans TaxID=1499966 RepID=A0A0S6VW77_9BACT|nr:transcriptional regulator, RpiR family [Candidatus Moduliflexus flocculans]